MKITTVSAVTGMFFLFCGSASAQSPMTCELAGARKVYTAKANLRCPADANAMEIEEVTADARVVQSLTKVTLNWGYVFRRKPSRGVVTFDVYGGGALLKSCTTGILNNDFSDTSSASDSAECDLPADSYGQIDRFVIRIKGAHR